METIPITPERKAHLERYAQRHGQDAAAALDEVLSDYLAWDEQDYHEAVEGIRRGYADLEAARIQSADQVFEELRVKHSLPR